VWARNRACGAPRRQDELDVGRALFVPATGHQAERVEVGYKHTPRGAGRRAAGSLALKKAGGAAWARAGE
jgi:hypothetical protein